MSGKIGLWIVGLGIAASAAVPVSAAPCKGSGNAGVVHASHGDHVVVVHERVVSSGEVRQVALADAPAADDEDGMNKSGHVFS